MGFEKAQASLRQALEFQPDDGPSKFYLQRIEELKPYPVSRDWTGEIDLREK
jgi:hypothetical protein